MPVQERYDFIDRMEEGREQKSARADRSRGTMRKLLDTTRDEIRDLGTGKLENFIENYFPHIWKDPRTGGEHARQDSGEATARRAEVIPQEARNPDDRRGSGDGTRARLGQSG
jgi:hypothetical protein